MTFLYVYRFHAFGARSRDAVERGCSMHGPWGSHVDMRVDVRSVY